MASPGRVQEAEKHLNEAEKCLKTTLFKWSPDYASAANHYEKAAVCFRNSRDHTRARDTYIKAAESHYNNNAIYHAGKSYEQAANVARDAKQLEEAAGLYQKASEYYNESGHPDTAGQILIKAAQLLQHENPELAAKYFLATAEYYELDEKLREAANSIKNAVRMYCRTRPRLYNKIMETAKLSRTAFLKAGAINMAHEAIAIEILAMLMEGQGIDSIDTLQEANSVAEFKRSDERALLEQLIDAVNQQDEETIIQCCDSGIFKSMDPEYAKFARDLKLGGDSQDPVSQTKKTKDDKTKETNVSSPKTAANDLKKKNPSQLADMRSQLFTKSTGEKISSKMPKPRNAYKPTPEETVEPPPREEPSRGLEEVSLPPLSKEPDTKQEPEETEDMEGNVVVEQDQGGSESDPPNNIEDDDDDDSEDIN